MTARPMSPMSECDFDMARTRVPTSSATGLKTNPILGTGTKYANQPGAYLVGSFCLIVPLVGKKCDRGSTTGVAHSGSPRL